MKRNVISVIALIIIAFGLCGCQAVTVPKNTQPVAEVPAQVEEVIPTPEPTETPTPTPEPTETPAPEEDTVIEEPSEIEEETNTDDQEVDELEARTEPCDKTLYANQSCNVRTGDSTDYERIGGLNYAQEVKAVGLSSTGWYKIEFGDNEYGYVSGKLLSDSKPSAQKQQLSASSSSGKSGGQKSSGGYASDPYADRTGVTWSNAQTGPYDSSLEGLHFN